MSWKGRNIGMWIQPRGWFWDWLFSGYQWYRRWCGGHWEQWWNDCTHSLMWFQVSRCYMDCISRPPCCFGKPICENYSERYGEP